MCFRPRYGVVAFLSLPHQIFHEIGGPFVELSGLVLIPLFYFLGVIGKIALIKGTYKAEGGAESIGFGELFSESLPYFWRVFGLAFIVGLVFFPGFFGDTHSINIIGPGDGRHWIIVSPSTCLYPCPGFVGCGSCS